MNMYLKKIKPHINTLGICVLFSLCLVLLAMRYKNKDNEIVQINKNLPPSEVIKLYWNASFEGDVDTVSQLITKEPESFLEKNKSQLKDSDILMQGDDVAPEQSTFQESQDRPNKFTSLIKSFKSPGEGVFFKYYKDSGSFSIYGTSHVININKYPARNLIIENEFTYEDESRVNLFYKSPYSGKTLDSSVFLKKEAEEWKIFLILYKSSLSLFDNENYGKPKPVFAEH